MTQAGQGSHLIQLKQQSSDYFFLRLVVAEIRAGSVIDFSSFEPTGALLSVRKKRVELLRKKAQASLSLIYCELNFEPRPSNQAGYQIQLQQRRNSLKEELRTKVTLLIVTKERKDEDKSLVFVGNRTFDLLVTKHVSYCCATTAALALRTQNRTGHKQREHDKMGLLLLRRWRWRCANPAALRTLSIQSSLVRIPVRCHLKIIQMFIGLAPCRYESEKVSKLCYSNSRISSDGKEVNMLQ